jgi:hypothetical protein
LSALLDGKLLASYHCFRLGGAIHRSDVHGAVPDPLGGAMAVRDDLGFDERSVSRSADRLRSSDEGPRGAAHEAEVATERKIMDPQEITEEPQQLAGGR